MVIGLTGGFGCGKSTALMIFKELGLAALSADEVCHQLYQASESRLCDPLRQRWGDAVFDANNQIDRSKIAQKVFVSDAELAFLEFVITPLILEKIKSVVDGWRRDNMSGVVEVPLLFEGNYADFYDRTAAVWSTPAKRIERLQRFRNFTADEIAARDARQMSPDAKLEAADYGLINNGGFEDLRAQIQWLVKQLFMIKSTEEI